jgi:uncharacterized protein (DUF1778 family)
MNPVDLGLVLYEHMPYNISQGAVVPVIEHRTERLEARITPETKALCQEAASLQGRTLTDFVVNSAVEAARRTLQENEFLQMTYRDRVAFVETLLSAPTAPNEKLRKAARRHARIFPG